MDEKREELIKNMTKRGLKSRKYAIWAKCVECIYDPQQPGTWRKQAEMCQCTTCPIYAHRPTPLERNND